VQGRPVAVNFELSLFAAYQKTSRQDGPCNAFPVPRSIEDTAMNPIPPLKTWLVAAVLVAIASSVQAEGNPAAARAASGPVPACMSDTGPIQHAGDVSHEEFSSLVDAVAGHALGEVWGRPVQDPRTRQLVAISAFLAQGNMEQLKATARHALELGVTQEQLKEVVYLTLARTGSTRNSDTAAGAINEIFSTEHSPILG
jgi:4-carboxymuconolactone decarboxylase